MFIFAVVTTNSMLASGMEEEFAERFIFFGRIIIFGVQVVIDDKGSVYPVNDGWCWWRYYLLLDINVHWDVTGVAGGTTPLNTGEFTLIVAGFVCALTTVLAAECWAVMVGNCVVLFAVLAELVKKVLYTKHYGFSNGS